MLVTSRNFSSMPPWTFPCPPRQDESKRWTACFRPPWENSSPFPRQQFVPASISSSPPEFSHPEREKLRCRPLLWWQLLQGIPRIEVHPQFHEDLGAFKRVHCLSSPSIRPPYQPRPCFSTFPRCPLLPVCAEWTTHGSTNFFKTILTVRPC